MTASACAEPVKGARDSRTSGSRTSGQMFTKLQALHDIAKPLSALRGDARNKALKQVAQGILDLARER